MELQQHGGGTKMFKSLAFKDRCSSNIRNGSDFKHKSWVVLICDDAESV